jgi:hypothetical protein
MRILPGECVPVALKRNLVSLGHECQTVREAGFVGKKNGELLTLAERRGCATRDGSQNRISTTHDWAKDWNPGSPREDEPTAGSPAHFANLRTSAALNPTWSGSRSRDVLAGF